MMFCVALAARSFTSPLAGEVDARSASGGGYAAYFEFQRTPLPNPPPQGGRERTTVAAKFSGGFAY